MLLLASTVSEFFSTNPLHVVYGVALAIGVVYAVFLLFFHGLSDALGDLDFGGHGMDVHMGHVDVGHMAGHMPGHVAQDSASDATQVSMLAIASFITSFGTFGLVSAALFGASSLTSLAVALLGGVIFGVAGQLFFLYILSPTVSGTVHQMELIGQVGEITVPIPVGGVGQIALVVAGIRMTYPARAAEDGHAIERGTPVRIDRLVGGVAYVSELNR